MKNAYVLAGLLLLASSETTAGGIYCVPLVDIGISINLIEKHEERMLFQFSYRQDNESNVSSLVAVYATYSDDVDRLFKVPLYIDDPRSRNYAMRQWYITMAALEYFTIEVLYTPPGEPLPRVLLLPKNDLLSVVQNEILSICE
jgi:hypothetical protein